MVFLVYFFRDWWTNCAKSSNSNCTKRNVSECTEKRSWKCEIIFFCQQRPQCSNKLNLRIVSLFENYSVFTTSKNNYLLFLDWNTTICRITLIRNKICDELNELYLIELIEFDINQDCHFLNAVKHTGLYPMPKGGNKLSDCKIKQIEKWIDNNYPN